MKFYIKLNRKSKINFINKDYLLINDIRLRTNGILDAKYSNLSFFYNYFLFMNQSLYIFLKTQDEPLFCFNNQGELCNLIFNEFFKSIGTITLTNLDTFDKIIFGITEFKNFNNIVNKIINYVNDKPNLYFMELESSNKRSGFIFVNYHNFLNKFSFDFIKQAVLKKENLRGFDNKRIYLFLDLTFNHEMTPEMIDFFKKINPIIPVRPPPKISISIPQQNSLLTYPSYIKKSEPITPPLKGLTPDFFSKIDKTLKEIKDTYLIEDKKPMEKLEINNLTKNSNTLLKNDVKELIYNHFKQIVKIQSELEKDNCDLELIYELLMDELNFTKVSLNKLNFN
jgi:hypothetical protein